MYKYSILPSTGTKESQSKGQWTQWTSNAISESCNSYKYQYTLHLNFTKLLLIWYSKYDTEKKTDTDSLDVGFP